MRKILVSSLAFAIVLSGLSFGAPRVQAATSVDGTLVAISGTTLPAVLTVQSGITVYTVNVTADTDLVRKFGGPSSLDEFMVADLLQVEGTVTGTTIDATKIKNLSIVRRGTAHWGKILSIDPDAKTFRFDPNRSSLDNQTVTTTTSTKVFQGNRKGAFSDLKVGMMVKIIGVWRPSLDLIMAERILIKITELNGKVLSVNCETMVLTMSVKKGQGSQTWTVNLTEKTVLRDKTMDPITCASIKVGGRVHVRGLRTAERTVTALQLWFKDVDKQRHAWKGEIVSIDAGAFTFVIDQAGDSADNRTVVKTDATIYVNENGTAITFGNLAVGHEVIVWGTLSGTTITSNLVMDKDLP